MRKALFRGKGKCVDFGGFEFFLDIKIIRTIVINNYIDGGTVTVNMKFA